MFYVPTAQNHVFRLERRDQTGYDVRDMVPPLVPPPAFQPSLPHIFLVRVALVRQMAEFHRLDDAVRNHRRSQTRAQAQEQHLATFVALAAGENFDVSATHIHNQHIHDEMLLGTNSPS